MLALLTVRERKRKLRKGWKCRLHNTSAWKSMTAPSTSLPRISESNKGVSLVAPSKKDPTGARCTSPFKAVSNKRSSARGVRARTRTATAKRERSRASSPSGKHAPLAAKKKSEKRPKGQQWTELGRNVDNKKSAQGRARETKDAEDGSAEVVEDEDNRATSTDYYDTDFESDTTTDSDVDGLQAYKTGCQVLGVSALPRAMSQWAGPTINLNYRNLGPTGAKALTSALMLNPHVQRLELQENRLGGIGGMYVSTYLSENVFITHLNLAQNNLGSMGAMAIAEIMAKNRTIEFLDLSDNNFRDSDGEHLARAIEIAERLETLNLSHNSFSEDGATCIGRAIGKNDSLQHLDFSWNQLRRKGAAAICAGVKRNTNVTSMNMSWNGLGYEGSIGIGEMLRGNDYLRELDISSNRINWQGAILVSKGLSLNYALEVLKIGKNPLTMTGCKDVLEAVNSNPDSRVTFLGFEDVPVNHDIQSMIESMRGQQKLNVAHGGVVESIDIIGRRKDIKKDPIQMLLDYLTSRGFRPVDLFRSLKQDDKNNVTKEAFLQGLQNARVPMHQRQIESILDSLDPDSEGKINFNLLMKGVKDQIRLNREEERRRIDQEDRFNKERKQLMALTPPLEKRSRKGHGLKTRGSDLEEIDWTNADWPSDDEDNEWENADQFTDSRSVTPVPVKTTYHVDRRRPSVPKGTITLPGIANKSSHTQLTKTRRQLTASEPIPEKPSAKKPVKKEPASASSRKQQKPTLLESQKIYKDKLLKDCETDPNFRQKAPMSDIENRNRMPQRLLPLPQRSTDVPTGGGGGRANQTGRSLDSWSDLDTGKPNLRGTSGRRPEQAGRSLDSWSDLVTAESSLPSAQFANSVNDARRRTSKLRPLAETIDIIESVEFENQNE